MLPFAFATDIHFDHADTPSRSAFLLAVREAPYDALVVTGDISRASLLIDHLKLLSLTGKQIYFVIGNHDCYGASITKVKEYLQQWSSGTADPKIGLIPPNLHYLPFVGVVPLSNDAILIGVDGYADGRSGNLLGSNIWLNDYVVCSTFAGCDDKKKPYKLQNILNQLGDESVSEFNALMLKINDCPSTKTIYVATHAPPFQEAHYAPDGSLGDSHWSPHFVNTVLGDAIKRAAKARPSTKFVVVCGHTHTGCRANVAENVTCLVGQASYRNPVIQDPKRLGYRAAQLY